LRKEGEYIQLKSAKICVSLLLDAPKDHSFDPSDIFSWLTSQLAHENPEVVDISVQYLQALLSVVEYRLVFFENHKAMQTLVDVMKASSNAQMQYQTIYVLWLLSFEPAIAAQLQKQYDIVPCFLEFAKSAIKEKVVRIIVATVRNLIDKARVPSF
jgi:V-type H+-transporting ATPase subunit H